MRSRTQRMILATAVAALLATAILPAQRCAGMTPEQRAQRLELENELQSIAIVERKLIIPMRDGTRSATDVYRPKDTSKKYPIVWVRTPYAARLREAGSRHRRPTI